MKYMLKDEGRGTGTRDDGPGEGTMVQDEGRRSETREDGLGRGMAVWDEGRRSLTKGRNTLCLSVNIVTARGERGPSV